MKIHLLATHLPPDIEGTGDYTWGMAQALKSRCELTILHPHHLEPLPLDGVKLTPAFRRNDSRSLAGVPPLAAAAAPDWFIAQYLPLGFDGSRIGNFNFLNMLSGVRRLSPRTKVALIIHERTPQILRSSNPLRRLWIRKRLDWAVSRSDVSFFLVETWAREFAARFRRPPIRALHLGSTFPPADLTHPQARERLGIAPGTIVLGLFGRGDSTRLVGLMRAAARILADIGRDVLVLHLGSDAGKTAAGLSGLPVRSSGPLEPLEVVRNAAAMDIFLAPYEDGVSTRRTSMMMALAAGLPVVGTRGSATSRLFTDADGTAMLLAGVNEPGVFAAHVARLAEDAGLRQRIGAGGRGLYERELTYKKAAEKLLRHLNEVSTGNPALQS